MMKKLNLNQSDIFLIVTLMVLSLLITILPNPFVTSSIVILGVIAVRLLERKSGDSQESISKDTGENSVNKTDKTEIIQTRVIPVTEDSNQINQTAEQKTAQEIITERLNQGAIEKAIDERFDKMVNSIVDDLFGSRGDITRELKNKLRENMSPYIEQYDYSQYNTKLELLLDGLVKAVTSNQNKIVKNVKEIMGVEPVKEIKSSELFDKYTEFIGKEIDTSKLEINTDDTPSYEYLTANLDTEEKRTYSSIREEKILKFTCEEDEGLGIAVTIKRWKNEPLLGNAWTIKSINRLSDSDETEHTFQTKSDMDITKMEMPLNNLRELNDLEIYLLKLHYDNTEIILDEEFIEDDEVEVDAEPEYTLL